VGGGEGGGVGGIQSGFLPHHGKRPAGHMVSTSASHAGSRC